MLLLCGATGELGGRVARRLADHGAPLRLLVRRAPDAAFVEELGADIATGDLRDARSLDRAVRGVATVVTTVTAMGRALSGVPSSVRDVDGRGTLALVDAAERAGVERFVFVSYAGLSDAAARRHPLAAAKRAVERRLAASRLREVIVRPDAFQEVWLGPLAQFDWRRGRVIVLGRGDARARYVAVDDVAAAVAAVAVADDPASWVEFGGPEPVTRNEAVAIFEDATGRAIRTIHVPRAALRAGMRILRRARPELASVMGLAYFADLEDATWTDAPLTALGIRPRSVTTYAQLAGRAGAREAPG
ncbi:MAG TPA: NmrA family NAD(P)-binding protein [Solirubrobacteraceae bacterium]|nr:NmrA family NAD(P)-binding protein [Solirubrobacteraceae bacterium]